MNAELVRAVKDKKAVLFVGAGVSKNLGLPDFSGLIKHLAKELDYDPDVFLTHGDYLSLAEFYQLEKGSIGPLRSWMDRTWHEGVNIGSSDVHRAIVKLECPVIYTTNYDSWLERAHDHYDKKYTKVSGPGDFGQVGPDAIEIVKFHGDFDNDDSIVLTESSYFDRLDFETPLDIKLRHDLLGKTVLFIGYSLADINIRYMLYRLDRQRRGVEHQASLRPKSFVYLTRPNPVQEKILESRKVHPIVSEHDEPGAGLAKFLQKLVHEAYGHG